MKKRKSILKKALIMLLCFCFCANMTGCGKQSGKKQDKKETASYEKMLQSLSYKKGDKVTLWYTKESDLPFLQESKKQIKQKYGVEVKLVLKDSVNYYEEIVEKSNTEEAPDLYLITNDKLKKYESAGLIEDNRFFSKEFLDKEYASVAVDAMTYESVQYGYPVYGETNLFLYDGIVVKEPVKTFDEILDFAENFEDDSNQKTILQWDVSNEMINYMFFTDQVVIKGEKGDNPDQMDMGNASIKKGLEYFQSLSNFLSIPVEKSSEEGVRKALSQEKVVFAICQGDYLKELENSKSNYKIGRLPDLTDSLKTKGISVTTLAAVNPLSKNSDSANLVASYMSYQMAKEQYQHTNQLGLVENIDRKSEYEQQAYEQYKETTPIAKTLDMGNFWIQADIMFQNIYKGNSVEKELKELELSLSK